MATEKPKRGRWASGVSGNPAGRKPGTGKVSRLRESLNPHLPKILKKLVSMALGGDVQAARILLERTIPPLRPAESPITITMPADAGLSAQGRAVIAATAAGTIAPSQAAVLLAGLAALAKIVEVDELAKRIEALERLGNGNA